ACPAGNAQQPETVGKEAQVLFENGQTALEQTRYDAALRAFTRAYALSSSLPKTAALAQLKIGSVYMAQRKFEAAAASFQRAITSDPSFALAHNNLGEALGELRQYTRALELFNRAVALDAKLLRARYNIGITYERLNNLKYAEFVFRLLVRDRPDYDLGFDGLAVTLAKSGRASEAIPFHQKAINLNPQEPSYYYNLGLSYLIAGDTEKALEQQKKLQVLAPEVANRLASVIVKKQMR
ncbi:MAG: tetratricopeptide repeat protein, partial [Acidobacteriota bacterium]|nr:tetratricopeptide repeat protein [Acidobacteriota bacterium]